MLERRERSASPADPAVRGPTPPREPWARILGRAASAAASRRFATAVARDLSDFIVEAGKIALGTSTVIPAPRDQRFADEAWTSNPAYRRLKQLYVAAGEALRRLPEHAGLEWEAAERARFAISVFLEAASPTNTLIGNPVALRRAIETRGASVARGARNAVRDVRSGRRIPLRSAPGAFTLGRDIAATPGAVVHRTEMYELIQYAPATETVHETPVLVLPSHVNKHYAVDLEPRRSFVGHAVRRGSSTFCVSWRDPGPGQAHWGLDAYVGACLEAADVVRAVTSSPELHLAGVCSAAMTASAFAAYLAQRDDRRLRSLTLVLATIDGLRFDPADLFSWEWVLRASRRFRRDGIVEGRDLTLLFSLRQSAERIWKHWVNDYLLGESPPPNVVLTWSDHDQNLPGALQDDFLELFSSNAFLRPGVGAVLGEPIDLSIVTADLYAIAGARDATSPWKSAFRATEAFGGRAEFVLSPTGHGQTLLAGARNPMATYFAGGEMGRGADHWQATAEQRSGSWWTHWSTWIKERSGAERPAPKKLGARRFRPMDAAPGRYVEQLPE